MDWLADNLATNLIAIGALALSAISLLLQVREKLGQERPVLHVSAQRSIEDTTDFGLFDLTVSTHGQDEARIVEVRSLKIRRPANAWLGSHMWNHKRRERRSVQLADVRVKDKPAAREEIKAFDLELARQGRGTPLDPLRVYAVVVAPRGTKFIQLEIQFSSPTYKGFKGRLRPWVELRELDIFI